MQVSHIDTGVMPGYAHNTEKPGEPESGELRVCELMARKWAACCGELRVQT